MGCQTFSVNGHELEPLKSRYRAKCLKRVMRCNCDDPRMAWMGHSVKMKEELSHFEGAGALACSVLPVVDRLPSERA